MRIANVRISKSAPPLRCPPDKSITHRSFLFSLLSQGKSCVREPLLGQDCLSSLELVRRLGAKISRAGSLVEIEGLGISVDAGSSGDTAVLEIDCGNSGTTMRIGSGLLVGMGRHFRLGGDESLSRRPMGRITLPLTRMGAVITGNQVKEKVTPPLTIAAPKNGKLTAISYDSPVASAQVKSAVLCAGLWCETGNRTLVSEPVLSRDHTERLLSVMGVDVVQNLREDGVAVASLPGMIGESLSPLDLLVPGDPSSAAFWACAAIMQDRSVKIENILLNPTRLGFVAALRRMGANVDTSEESTQGGESVGRLKVEGGRSLKGVTVEPFEVPSMIDEIPMLAIAALWAKGTSEFRGCQELRVKESDRLEAVMRFIRSIGGETWARGDDLFVEGLGHAPTGPKEGEWNFVTQKDHRLAMAAVVTADALNREIILDDVDCIKVSYPGFFEHREKLK